MSEQQPLIEEPKAAGSGKEPETCGTCRYQRKNERCHFERAERIEVLDDDGERVLIWEHPPAQSHWPACGDYFRREIRRDR